MFNFFITYFQQSGIIVGGIPSQVDCLQSLKERDARITLKKKTILGFLRLCHGTDMVEKSQPEQNKC